jgi:hypothetical protein
MNVLLGIFNDPYINQQREELLVVGQQEGCCGPGGPRLEELSVAF